MSIKLFTWSGLEIMKFCKIGKWHRSHGKLVHYQDQITRPPFWDMWHMRRQSTSNDSLTSISHQCVVLRSIFFSHFSRRPAPSTKCRQQTSHEKNEWTLYKKWTQFPCKSWGESFDYFLYVKYCVFDSLYSSTKCTK